MNERVQEVQIKKERLLLEKKSNRFLKIFLFVFCCGYLFFFSSPYWLPPEYIGVDVTEPGEVINANDREITMLSWTYSKEEKKIQAIIEINNTSLDGIERYEWSAVDSAKGFLQTEAIVETDDFAVIHINRVPGRFTEVSLRMDLRKEDRTGDAEFNTVKLYASRDSVKKVNEIETKDISAYKKDAITYRIKACRKEIRGIEKENEETRLLISEAEEKIRMLENDERYQTAEEKLKTDQKINELSGQIDLFNSQIEDNNAGIAQLKEKIRLLKEQLKALGG